MDASIILMAKQVVRARIVLLDLTLRLTRMAVAIQAAFPKVCMRISAKIAPALPSQLWIFSEAKVAVLREGSCGA